MATVAETQAHILAAIRTLTSEHLPLDDAPGRVLATRLVSTRTLPGFDNSAMDGYALRAGDVRAATADRPVVLPVSGESYAGSAPGAPLRAGTAMRIMTGAPVPAGADAVVRQEDTDRGRDAVGVTVAVTAGTNVRRAGEDIRPGDVVLTAGRRLRSADLAVCAALGHVRLEVARRPRVAVLSTGDELVDPEREPGPGQVVDCNGPAIAAAVREAGGEPVRLGIACDTVSDLRERFREASRCDLVVSTAGVSVGDHDHVRDIVAELGALTQWRVAMRPGKPLAVGRVGSALFLGLPGNPVSSQVTFELFGRPAILALQGADEVHRRRSAARAGEDMAKPRGLETYVRATLRPVEHELPLAFAAGSQSSGVMSSMVLADCLLVLPAAPGLVPAGTILETIPLA